MNDIVLALDGQVKEVTAIVSELRNHPAGTTDNGRLAGLANRLENSASSIATAVASLHQRGSQPADEAPVDEAPVDEAPVETAVDDSGIDGDGTLTAPVGEQPAVGDTQLPPDATSANGEEQPAEAAQVDEAAQADEAAE